MAGKAFSRACSAPWDAMICLRSGQERAGAHASPHAAGEGQRGAHVVVLTMPLCPDFGALCRR